MALKTVEYVDDQGRRWARGLPEGVPDSKAKTGVPLGPPSFASLGLPLDVEIRLHNQLYERGILSETDARRHLPDIHSALMFALRVDAHRVLSIYQGLEAEERSA